MEHMPTGFQILLPRLIFVAVLLGAGRCTHAAEISVRLSDPPTVGFVLFRLFNSANTFGDERDPVREYRYPLDGRAAYVLTAIAPGEYALLVFHDENDNHQLDKNFIGIPREPLGFSNDYRPKGPPSYSKARFQLQDEIAFDVTLRRPLGKRGRFGVGIGALGRSSPYRGADNGVLRFIPAVSYNGKRLQWFGPSVKYGLLGSGHLRLAATGRYRLGVYEDDDSDFLEGMGDRSDTFMAGLDLQLDIPGGIGLSLGYEHDALDEIGGGEGRVELDKSFQWRVLRLSPSARVNWTSSGLANHDFGVPGDRATDNRSAYEVDDTLSMEAGLSAFVEITQNGMAMLRVAAEFFDDEVTDSPIVEDDYVVKGFAAVTYLF